MEIDSLEIKISASAEQANKAIRHLTRSLGTLSSALKFDTSSLEKLGKINGNNFKKLGEGLQSFANAARTLQGVDSNNFNKLADGLSKIASIDSSKLEALGKIDGNSFRGLGEGVKALSAGLKDLKGVSTKKFETLASGIERLGAIQVGNMQAAASALTPLADGIRTLSSVNFDNRNLQSLINSLTRLANANVSGLSNVDFTALGNSIKGLATALSGADKVEQNTISMTNAIAKLAGTGANIGTVTAELPRLGTALKDFINTMSSAPILASETIAFTQALGQLANTGSRAETVANSLQHLGDELKRFMQTMATAPNVSTNVIQMTQALGQLANTGGGTGRAASSIGNAFDGASVAAIRFSSNTNVLSVSLKGLGTRLNKTLKNVKSFTSQILAAAGIMGGLYGIIRGGLKAMDISSSLTEVQNVVDTTFGDMSDKVQEFADNSIRQFGMSELSVKQFASRFQAMGTAMGIPPSLIKSSNEYLNKQTEGYVGLSDSMSDVSLNLTKLTADIASFYDVEQAEVAEDLAAIYTGMTVPLRKYGLDLTQATLKEWAMKEGLDANIASMSQAEKTMLRYKYVLANTTAAQGDFAKTADTWANQVRILKQSFEELGSIIGGSLINAFKPLVQTLNNVLQYVIAFAEKVTEALGTIFGWKYESGGTGGIAQDWSDIADTTGEAADNIDKMKKGLRAFDELNNITSPDKTGGGAGAGGAGEGAGGGLVKTDAIWEKYKSDIDTLSKLGKYIGDALSKAMESIDWDSIYQKARNFGRGLAEFLNGLISPRLFENIGKTIAGALNTALHFLDSFGLWFNWKNFGDSLAAGLLGFLNNIQWDVALSAATHWGKGIANTLNHFITPETFSATGHAIAMALNTAVQFALSFGQTFDFKNLGESIAAGINDFFATFDFAGFARTLNIWAKGILDALITALDKTDWSMVGKKIGKFIADIDLIVIGKKLGKALWKAINAGIKAFAGIFSKAPFETIVISIAAIPKALKAITASKFVQGLAGLVTQFKNFAVGAKLVAAALAGNATSLSTLMVSFPKLGKVISVLSDSFLALKMGIADGQFFAGANLAIENLRNNLTGLQKGVIIAVAGFAEFSVVSDSVEKLTLGTENWLAEIGKIAGVVAAAGAAMYVALGPAGIAVTAIVGVVGAIKGINDAFDEIHAENVGNAINDALTRPGGTDLNEILTGFVDKMQSIGDSFSTISEKSSSLESAKKNISNTVFEIDKIKTSLDAGVMTAEEAIPKLTNLYEQLADAIITKIGAAGDVLLATFADDSISAKAFESAGLKAEEMREQVVSSMDEQEKAVYEMRTELENLRDTDPTNPRIPELESQMIRMASGLTEAEKALEELSLETANGINWSEYLNEDGLDIDRLKSALTEYQNTIINTRETAETEFNAAVLAAKELGDEENYNAIKTALPGAMEYMNNLTADEALRLVNTLQKDAIGGIDAVIEEAQTNWENMNWWEKMFSGFADEGSYVMDYVEKFKSNTIDPLSSEIESMMSQLGIDGAGWSADAMNAMLDGMWEYDIDTREVVVKEGFTNVIRGGIEAAEAGLTTLTNTLGGDLVRGISQGIDSSVEEAISSITNASLLLVNSAKEALGVHSPSTVFAEIGNNVIEGLSNGIDALKDQPVFQMTMLSNNLVSQFSSAGSEFWSIGQNMMQGLHGGIMSMAASVASAAQGIAQGAANAIRSALEIHSPSRIMFQLGDYTMQGFQNGLENLYQPILSSVKEFSTDLQLTPSFEVGQFQPMPPPEFDFEAGRQGVYEIAAEIQRENSRTYSNSEEHSDYSEELSLLMSQNQLLREQNRLLQAILDKPTMDTDSVYRAVTNKAAEHANYSRGKRLVIANEVF